MPARLVYAPKVYAYTKAQNGVTYNLTNYITAGEVQRKVNQVSSATITLRNPQKVFTGGGGSPRAFHPMDPITIYLERISGAPVRVFTGYLDTTPYYQMYPGTITLQASCTLKRLLYSFFDPSLPYVIAFFTKYGWVNTGSGSIISSSAFSSSGATQAQVTSGAKPFTDLQDGSLGHLLWAILYEIGQWQDSNIYVENLPSGSNGIAQRMQALMQSIDSSQAQAATDFSSFLEGVIGAGTYGSGGGDAGGSSTGALTNTGKLTCKGQPLTSGQISIINTALQVGTGLNAPTSALIACIYAAMGESGISIESGGGVWQDTSSPDPSNVQNEANAWFTGKYGFHGGGIANSKIYSTVWQIANATEDNAVWGDSKGDSYAHEFTGGQAQGIAEATAIVNSFSGGSINTGSGNVSTSTSAPSDTAASGIGGMSVGTVTQAGATAPASTSSTAAYSGYVNPLGQCQGLNAERIDQGVDYSMQSGSPIVSIGNCTCVGAPAQSNWYAGQPIYTFQFNDGPLQGKIWYLAEQIDGKVSPNQTVKAGDTVATYASSGTGIEIGWANSADGTTLAQGNGGYTEGSMTAAGQNFSAFLKALGAPAGVPQSQTMGTVPSSFPTDYNNYSGGTSSASSASGSGGGTGAASSVSDTSTAQAFVAELDFPSVEDQVTAIALGSEHKGLMHDQSLMPFIQQVAQSSLRSFQSLPNGDFYAFYPDYFGEMGHHDPYWYIHDIEILNGGINLTDDALATHVFAVGDNTWPVNDELLNMLFSAGAINIFNAFVGTGIVDTSATSAAKTDGTGSAVANAAASALTKPSGKTTKQNGGLDPGVLQNANEAVEFIKRYGARPLVQDYPMVRSPIYEMLLAYQQFMFAWSNQFKTPFTFTFMPELFPGGKVAFPEHGIQMYVNSVTHSWNYQEGGFTTDAELSAPALMSSANSSTFPDLPPFMVQALVEPLRLPGGSGPTSGKSTATQAKTQATQQSTASKSTTGATGTAIQNRWWYNNAPSATDPNGADYVPNAGYIPGLGNNP